MLSFNGEKQCGDKVVDTDYAWGPLIPVVYVFVVIMQDQDDVPDNSEEYPGEEEDTTEHDEVVSPAQFK